MTVPSAWLLVWYGLFLFLVLYAAWYAIAYVMDRLFDRWWHYACEQENADPTAWRHRCWRTAPDGVNEPPTPTL